MNDKLERVVGFAERERLLLGEATLIFAVLMAFSGYPDKGWAVAAFALFSWGIPWSICKMGHLDGRMSATLGALGYGAALGVEWLCMGVPTWIVAQLLLAGTAYLGLLVGKWTGSGRCNALGVGIGVPGAMGVVECLTFGASLGGRMCLLWVVCGIIAGLYYGVRPKEGRALLAGVCAGMWPAVIMLGLSAMLMGMPGVAVGAAWVAWACAGYGLNR